MKIILLFLTEIIIPLLLCSHRILLSWPPLATNVQELMAEVSFIKPKFQSLEDLPGDIDEEEEEKQLEILQNELEPVMMKRPRSIIGNIFSPSLEVRIPVKLRSAQIESYKMVMTKSYELLADPKASRFSGYRAVQLRGVVSDLRAVCAHPQLEGTETTEQSNISPKSVPELENELKLSEKLEALDVLLRAEQEAHKRIAIFAHCTSVLDLLSKCIKLRFGDSSCVLIDSATPSLERHEAITLFNQPESAASFIVMHPKACGLGTILEHLDSIVFFDSDWSVTSDITALCRARKLGDAESLRVYRLYCQGTIEEKLLALAEKTKGMEVALRQSHGRAYSQGAKVLDEILRAGVEEMFSMSSPGAQRDVEMQDVKLEETKVQPEDRTQTDEDIKGTGLDPIHNAFFQGNNIDKLINVDPAEAFAAARKSQEETLTSCPLCSDISGATIIDLTPLKPCTPSGTLFTSQLSVDNFFYHHVHVLSAVVRDENEEGGSGEDVADPDAQSRAEAALMASKFWSELLGPSWQDQKDKMAAQNASPDYEEEEEEDEGLGRRVSSSIGAASYDDEDDLWNRRRGRGRGRGRSRGGRRRHDDEDDPYLRKRRRREQQHPALTPEALEYIAEWNRQTAVMNAIADPSTAEALIARNAFDRLDDMGNELALPKHIVDLAHQV